MRGKSFRSPPAARLTQCTGPVAVVSVWVLQILLMMVPLPADYYSWRVTMNVLPTGCLSGCYCIVYTSRMDVHGEDLRVCVSPPRAASWLQSLALQLPACRLSNLRAAFAPSLPAARWWLPACLPASSLPAAYLLGCSYPTSHACSHIHAYCTTCQTSRTPYFASLFVMLGLIVGRGPDVCMHVCIACNL
jgi:hypothetical protein